jgi:hypothetical protein
VTITSERFRDVLEKGVGGRSNPASQMASRVHATAWKMRLELKSRFIGPIYLLADMAGTILR